MPKNVMSDSEILLADYITSKKYKEKLRLVKFYDEKEGRELAFRKHSINYRCNTYIQ